MNTNQKKGVGFIITGILLLFIIPQILNIFNIYIGGVVNLSITIISLILVGFGIRFLVLNNETQSHNGFKQDSVDSINKQINSYQNYSDNNKVVNVNLTGGIIGLIGDSPHNALNRRIKIENENGWKVVQIIPSSSGNILIIILRMLLLILTLFFYTTSNGYYLILERNHNE